MGRDGYAFWWGRVMRISYRCGFKARTASVVHATHPSSSTELGGSMRVDEEVSGSGGAESRSSIGISLTPTEKRVRRRLGSFIRRSDTLGGMVARTLVLYTKSDQIELWNTEMTGSLNWNRGQE